MLSIFKRPLIIMSGGYDKAAGKNVGVSSTALYQVIWITITGMLKRNFWKFEAVLIGSASQEILFNDKDNWY